MSASDAVADGRGVSLRGRLLDRAALDPPTRQAMFALLSTHFTGVDAATFAADLDEKTAVVLLEDEAGGLRGFSTLLVYESRAAGRPVTVVYSGDTIVERGWWGSPALAQGWLRAVRQLAAGGGEVYWLLITSGFRTYRFLPVFFRAFHPGIGGGADGLAALRDLLARERFGDRYDPATGIVRLPRPQVLGDRLLDVADGRVLDPHVRFFLDLNPGYTAGDELACLTPLDDANLTPAGRRVARRIAGG